MVSRSLIDAFLSQRRLAVVGVSRGGKKFGNAAYRGLRAAGYRVFAVNPHTSRIEGDPWYPSLAALPEPVGGALLVVPPADVELLAQAAAAAGITRLWLQQGAESTAAVKYCAEHGIQCIHGECILMFVEPGSWFHRAHRGLRAITGRLPH